MPGLHSQKQIRQIAKSIERFGFCNPVLTDDNNQIVAGHGRVAAAKLLGLEAVPVVRLSHLSESEKRAYILADNKLAERAGWDRDLLAIELQGLTDLNFEIDLTGFEAADVDFILDDAPEVSGTRIRREDEVPAYGKGAAVSRVHDLWALGDHRLLCADAREQTSYDVLLDGQKSQFVFTDPLYDGGGNVGVLGPFHYGASGKIPDLEFITGLTLILERLVANTVDGSIHMICMDWRLQAEMLAAGSKVYSKLEDLCFWNKSKAGVGSFYRSKHELIYVWKNGLAPHVDNFKLGRRHRSNVWDYTIVATARTGQLQEGVKPVALIADAIKDVSAPGDLVLDPFAGSGTIVIAAERTGRKARALEIDPAYVDVAVRRWQSYSGKPAVLVATGETFEQRERRITAETVPA